MIAYKGGFAVFLSKTVVFKCFTFLEKFLTEVAGRILLVDLVWGQEPSWDIGETK
jgi:hypothetical protein